MGADKTKSIMTLSSGVSQPLLADVQYFELYSSLALNRKLKNIVMPGFYCGFEPVPGTGLSVRITSENSEGKGAASVDVNNVQISVQQIEDVTVSVKAGATNIIVLEANFEHGVKTTQVDSASSVSAARIYARTDNTIGQNQIELCRVIVPSGATAVTKEMIVLKYRVNRAVGVEFSNEISSTEERKAATPLAVKTLHDLVDTKAPLDSPHLSGTPTSPTPEPGTNNTQIANAAFVYAAINALINGAPGTMDTLKEIAAAINNDPKFSETINKALALKAPLASPAFTGTPTVPTASQGTNSTQIANTAFVKAAITALINGAPGTLDTLKEIAAAINNDPNFSTTINNALALKAPLASPALTGIPTAPTAAQGTNNTQIATTAYVRAAISALVGSSPEALDTLNELAAALGNDPNFATTMTNALAGKQPLDATLTALAGLTTGANKLPYFTGTDTVSQTDLTSVGRDILAKTSTLAVIQYLGLREIGTSGEKIPLLSTANTWSSQQTFKGKTAFSAAATFSAGIAGAIDPEDIGGQTVDLNNLTIRSDVGAIKYYYCPTSGGGANITNKPDGVTGNFLLRVESTRKVSASDYANMQTLISNDTKRIYVRFVVNGSWAAWSQVVVSGWGQDVSVKSLSAVALSGSLTGNASTATKLQTVRTIGGVSFDGSANIDLPGVNKTGNQSTTGNAATATKLQTARTIGGVSFDGTANINLPGVNVAGNQNTSGNAATATKLQTARTINGVSFDGSKNIELTPRSIGTINSTTMSFSGGAGWFKLATVTMPQSSSVVYISLIGGAGYNVNSPMQAGISELVLRAGNGNPKGLTGALWRRTSVGFTNFAWVNTSGDTYDVYVEIGNYATGVNIQWDYTSNASVTIHTSPTYTANKPKGLTDGTVYVIYSSHIKPTATDVGALPIAGGNLNGGLTATGEIISKSANGLRIAYGNYGFFIRNDGSNTFFMLTDSGNSLGTYNNLRPLIINNANGTVTIGNGLNVTGGINGSLNGNAATATKLQTARTINGVKFDGSANITLTAANFGLSDSSGYVGRLVNTQVFTSSGTYTPTPGTKRIRVTITGGGGGGGGCKAISNNETFFGAGGGAGGTIISIMTPTQNSYPVTIGAGGAGGVSATNGTSGGNSVFASLIAPGGAGGGKVGVTNTNGGNGGVPSTGDIRITGGHGGDGQSGNIGVSGEGGTSHWGGGGRAGAGGGVSGKAYGSGGGGAYDAGYSGTSMTGGKGAAGICIIEEFA
ncbi:tail fiber protein [Escherichia coli]|nr:phage tail protein [Shigella sonnei]EHV2475773.1 tail fiber protein [Escherichia coli]EIM6243589.1 tail fiber protein [Escherichia coli]